MNKITIIDRFKDLIPPLTQEESQELKNNIIKYGCRDPLITWNDILIDGHNRFIICTENDIAFKTISMDYDFENEEEVEQWIIRNQFGRRNISAYDRTLLALKLKNLISKKAKENQSKAGGNKRIIESKKDESPLLMNSSKAVENDNEIIEPITTRTEIAKLAGVSEQTINRVEKIENEAPENIKQAARKNVISINRAFNISKEVKLLDDPEAEAEKRMQHEYQMASKKIDNEEKKAKIIADFIESPIFLKVEEEHMSSYLEYSPSICIEDFVKNTNKVIEKLEYVKSLFISQTKVRSVKA